MTQEPTAWSLLRAGLAVMLDAVGVVLLVWLVGQVLFGGSQLFETEALWIGAIGALACWLTPGARRNLPIPLLAYVGVAVLSAAMHQWPVVSAAPAPNWWALLTPAVSLMTMAVVVLGAAHLLRSPWRLSVFVVLLGVSIQALAVQVMFDRTVSNFVYNEAGSTFLPSVAQWGGLHQTGLLLVIGLPLSLAVSILGRSAWRMVAGLLLAAGLLVVAFFNGSRAGIGIMALTTIGMVTMGLGLQRSVSARWMRGIFVVVVLALPAALWYAATHVTTSMRALSLTAGRLPIWKAAGSIVRDHPWLGAGPGNYSVAMVEGGYAAKNLPGFPHITSGVEQAHNLLIHVAAETGVFGALFLLGVFAWFLRACWKAVTAGDLPVVAAGLLFALAAFLARSMSDNFLDGLVTVDRTRVLVWSLFAAALAVSRLPLNPDRSRA